MATQTMDDLKKKILSHVYQASFPAEDVSLWEKVITNIPDELVSDLLNFVEKTPNSITFLNDGLKKKKEYINSGDEKILEEVLADQKKFLKSLAPNLNLEI